MLINFVVTTSLALIASKQSLILVSVSTGSAAPSITATPYLAVASPGEPTISL